MERGAPRLVLELVAPEAGPSGASCSGLSARPKPFIHLGRRSLRGVGCVWSYSFRHPAHAQELVAPSLSAGPRVWWMTAASTHGRLELVAPGRGVAQGLVPGPSSIFPQPVLELVAPGLGEGLGQPRGALEASMSWTVNA